MARPKKQTVDYFPHICDHKKTMFILEQRYGNDGYALWFKLLEFLGKSEGHYIDFRNDEDKEFFASYNHMDWDKCKDILNLLAKLDAIDKKLWEINVVWSDNFIEGIKEAYRNRVVDCPKKPTFLHDKNTNKGISDVRNPQMKVNEMKKDESICTPLTPLKTDDNNDVKTVINHFNNNIHPVTPTEGQKLIAWLDDGMEAQLITWAMNQAVLNSARKMSYIEAILRNLEQENVTTLAGALARERDRLQTKQDKQGNNKPREPSVPELTDEEKIRLDELNKQIEKLSKEMEMPP